MAKTKKITQDDIKKLFESTKKKLQQLGKETSTWIKKGEVELSRISKIGRLELDIVNLSMKKEKLYRDIGKRIVEQGLGEEIGDSAVKNMCLKAKAIISDSRKRQRAISKIKRGLLKSKKTQSKKRK